jgi:hypothetical protein
MNSAKKNISAATIFIGALISGAMVSTLFNTNLALLAIMIIIMVSDLKINQDTKIIFNLSLTVIFWILIKSVILGIKLDIIFVELFSTIIITMSVMISQRKNILLIFLIILIPLVFLDMVSNYLQLSNGYGLFGTEASNLRTDGSRLTGIWGHSFKSISLYAVFYITASSLTSKYDIYKYLLFIPMMAVGSFRSFVFPALTAIQSMYNRLSFGKAYLISILLGILVITANILSVKLEFLSYVSGNGFRIFAWQNAITEIMQHPVFGSPTAVPIIDPEFTVSESNIIFYKIAESSALQDAVRYGLPLMFLKFFLLWKVANFHFKTIIYQNSALQKAKNYLAMLLVIDYLVFSFLSMPFFSIFCLVLLTTPGKSSIEQENRSIKAQNKN